MSDIAKKVLSVRIPATAHTELKSYCKNKGITVSEYVGKSFADINQVKLFDNNPTLDNDIERYLVSLGGGSLAGILSYKAVYNVMQEKFPEWSEGKLTTISSLSGVATAMAVGFGLTKLMSALADE